MPAINTPMPSSTAAPSKLGKKPSSLDNIALTGSSRPLSSSAPSSAGSAISHTPQCARSASSMVKPGLCRRASKPALAPARRTAARTRRAASQASTAMVAAPISRGA